MIDVGGNDRAASGHFIAHKFRRDDFRNAGAPGLSGMLRNAAAMSVAGREFARHFAGLVLSDRDEFHLRRHDAFAGIVNLGHVPAGFGAKRFADMLEPQFVQFRIGLAHPSVLGGDVGQFFDICPVQHPLAAERGEPGARVDGDGRIGVRA